MAISIVQMYRAGDGTLHDSLIKAQQADVFYELHQFIEKIGGYDAQFILDFITENYKEFQPIFTKYYNATEAMKKEKHGG